MQETTGEAKMRHFISLRDWGAAPTQRILERASELARLWRNGEMPQTLAGKRIAFWFHGNGFRNRLAFELGAKQMGATVAYVPGELGVHEPIEDVAGYLQNWFSMLVLRAKRHEDLLEVATRSNIPIINARTDKGHPCEVLGDLMYLRERREALDGLKVVFVGEATNLGASWLEAAAVLPITVIQVCPEGYAVAPEILGNLRDGAVGDIQVSHDLEGALSRADVIYTDCWPSAADPDEAALIRQKFLPYQITQHHLTMLSEHGVFLPCPPVTRGEEVSDEAMLSGRCENYAAKACLLHVQNAIMEAVTLA
jgi:ornithine carbamoyltransferase